jgi:hypothetical protein
MRGIPRTSRQEGKEGRKMTRDWQAETLHVAEAEAEAAHEYLEIQTAVSGVFARGGTPTTEQIALEAAAWDKWQTTRQRTEEFHNEHREWMASHEVSS